MQHETFNAKNNILISESQGGVSSLMSKARGLHAARIGETYRLLAERLAMHNDQRRDYACSILEDYEDDKPLVLHFNANTKVIHDDEGKGAYVTCSVWVPNPNYKEEDNAQEA